MKNAIPIGVSEREIVDETNYDVLLHGSNSYHIRQNAYAIRVALEHEFKLKSNDAAQFILQGIDLDSHCYARKDLLDLSDDVLCVHICFTLGDFLKHPFKMTIKMHTTAHPAMYEEQTHE